MLFTVGFCQYAGAQIANPVFFNKKDRMGAEALVESGRYQEAIEVVEEELKDGGFDREILRTYVRALLATGRYGRAGDMATSLFKTYPNNLPSIIFAYETLRQVGREKLSTTVLEYANKFAKAVGGDVQDYTASELVALGKAALGLGAEPKFVLENFYEVARKRDPSLQHAHLTAAGLAMDKHDYALAAEILADAGDGPDVQQMLARAFEPSDRAKADGHLAAALEMNPLHFPSLLQRARQAVDAGDYTAAGEDLEKVLGSDANHSGALALEAALAYLQGDTPRHREFRGRALKFWTRNPAVDHAIGKVLSRKRRFVEGRSFQEKALAIDQGYLPAKLALAFDFLRLGDEEGAWKLAEEVHAEDAYNVHAFNLVTLKDHLSQFETLRSGNFILRMVPREAGIYGDRVLELLTEAEGVLCKKYGLELEGSVLVEFFPQQQDFAVRTLGVPGGAGILGACFGSVITMNSPGGVGAGVTNWEATLWHEFCHVVTITVTESRIPRWLSEGISVYEERQRSLRWGLHMTPAFRAMVLGAEGVLPLADLESGFTRAPDGEHLLFAYYQSSLAVEYFVETFGLPAVREILDDLRRGVEINVSMAQRLKPLAELEKEFAAYVQAVAGGYAPDADWIEPPPGSPVHLKPELTKAFLKKRPNNLWALKKRCGQLLENGDLEAAVKLAERLVDLLPGDLGEDGGLALLAQAYRAKGDVDGERVALQKLAAVSGDADFAFRRLTEIGLSVRDWELAAENARRQTAVNPMRSAPYRCLGHAHEVAGSYAGALRDFRKVLDLGVPDRPAIHFRIASAHEALGDPVQARRHVLMALEEAPRAREGHRMLLRLKGGAGE